MLSVIDDLGIPGIIDVHAHFMPHEVMVKVWNVFDSASDVYGVEWPIEYRGSDEQRLAQLREFGVVAFSSLVYAHKPGMAAWLNEWCSQFASITPDCLHTATFYPESGVAQYLQTAIESGARICKIHLQVGGFDPRDELLMPAWELLSNSQIPTVVHCGSGPLPGPFTGPGPISDVLRTFPTLPVIVAHMGAPEYAEFLAMTRIFDNVYLDTTMAFTDFMNGLAPFPAELTEQLLAAGDAQRILFGSDFPNIPYSYADAVAAIVRLGLGERWSRAVLYEASARIFRFDAK